MISAYTDKWTLKFLLKMKEEQLKEQFVVCLDNQGYEASLEVGKLYRMIPDAQAATHGYMRVVDESGEDYAYTADRFFSLELPREVEETLLALG
jgi:hypothetical protein